MGDAVEELPLASCRRIVAKDAFGDLAADDLAIRPHDGVSQALAESRDHLWILEDLMADLIGVHKYRARRTNACTAALLPLATPPTMPRVNMLPLSYWASRLRDKRLSEELRGVASEQVGRGGGEHVGFENAGPH